MLQRKTKPTQTTVDRFETLVGLLCKSGPQLPLDSLTSYSPRQKAEVALFCYGRVHMRELGVRIAAACEQEDLIAVGAAAGRALYSVATMGSVAIDRRMRTPITLPAGQAARLPFEYHEPDADELVS